MCVGYSYSWKLYYGQCGGSFDFGPGKWVPVTHQEPEEAPRKKQLTKLEHYVALTKIKTKRK